MVRMSTLCYIERDGQYLMLHRVIKENDINHDKWIGVGGHFEHGESPEECVLREVKEETGYDLTSYKFRGIVTFVYGEDTVEYMHLYTADGFTGEPIECDEGILEWVDKKDVWNLELWEGDRIFFRLLDEREDFFSLKLVYDTEDVLEYAALDGKPLELFDLLNEDGTKNGVVQERGVAHRLGTLHGTVHIWLLREKKTVDGIGAGRVTDPKYEVLLQKRSADKDSNPGCYDISAAGHIPHGEDRDTSAVRETQEEIGLTFPKPAFEYVGTHRGTYQAVFHGKDFRDDELMSVYVVRQPFDERDIRPQESEVESVMWMDFDDCYDMIHGNTLPNCMYEEEYLMVRNWLREHQK